MDVDRCSSLAVRFVREDPFLRRVFSRCSRCREVRVGCHPAEERERLFPGREVAARGCFVAPTEEEPLGRVVLFADFLFSGADIREVLRHEMTHAFDTFVHNANFENCYHLACSEIRAAMMAECHGKWFRRTRKRCIERTATTATGVHCHLADMLVKVLLEECMNLDPDIMHRGSKEWSNSNMQ